MELLIGMQPGRESSGTGRNQFHHGPGHDDDAQLHPDPSLCVPCILDDLVRMGLVRRHLRADGKIGHSPVKLAPHPPTDRPDPITPDASDAAGHPGKRTPHAPTADAPKGRGTNKNKPNDVNT